MIKEICDMFLPNVFLTIVVKDNFGRSGTVE